jgi:FtsP/CotA-like multicopper oxidase with cupredoxin domain
MVIADIGETHSDSQPHPVPATSEMAVHKEPPQQDVRALEDSKPDFTVTFTEDKKGLYINGEKFSMKDGPMLHVKIGSMQHWRINNATSVLHPFHIHQIHFLAYAENGVRMNTGVARHRERPVSGHADLQRR